MQKLRRKTEIKLIKGFFEKLTAIFTLAETSGIVSHFAFGSTRGALTNPLVFREKAKLPNKERSQVPIFVLNPRCDFRLPLASMDGRGPVCFDQIRRIRCELWKFTSRLNCTISAFSICTFLREYRFLCEIRGEFFWILNFSTIYMLNINILWIQAIMQNLQFSIRFLIYCIN